MLSRAQKEEQVAEIREKMIRSTGVFVVDYRGLNVAEANELRRKLRGDDPSQSEYRVIKNSVLRLAATGTD